MGIYEAMDGGMMDSFLTESGMKRYASGDLVLYHGTSRENADKIMSQGLRNPLNSPKWYMLSDTVEDAIWHTSPDNDPVVIKFTIPAENEPWKGYPWLWPGSGRSSGPSSFTGEWYAPKETIPTRFITSVSDISREEYDRVRGQ